MMRGPLVAVSALVVLGAVLGTTGLRAEDGRGFDPRFRQGLAKDVLADGPPPLRRGDVRDLVSLLEASFALAVPDAMARDLTTRFELAWPKLKEPERDELRALVGPIDALRRLATAGDAVGVESGLATFRRGLDRYLQGHRPGPLIESLEKVLRLRREKGWPGTPPIHGAAAAAWFDLADFFVSLGRNEDVQPTVGQQSVVFEALHQAFQDLDEATRRRVKDVHRPWLRLKAHWLEADGAERLALRFAALRLLADGLPEDRAITVGDGRDLKAYARVAGLLRTVQTGYDAWSNLARRPKAVLDVVDAWRSKREGKEPLRPLLK